MRLIILIIFAICIAWTVKGQDISTRAFSFGITDGDGIYTNQGGQLSLGYDLSKKGFNLTPEVDLNLILGDAKPKLVIIPGLKLGHDNFYVTSSYDPEFRIHYYGIGGLIPLTEKGSGVSLKVLGGLFEGFAVGYASVGYTFKIK